MSLPSLTPPSIAVCEWQSMIPGDHVLALAVDDGGAGGTPHVLADGDDLAAADDHRPALDGAGAAHGQQRGVHDGERLVGRLHRRQRREAARPRRRPGGRRAAGGRLPGTARARPAGAGPDPQRAPGRQASALRRAASSACPPGGAACASAVAVGPLPGRRCAAGPPPPASGPRESSVLRHILHGPLLALFGACRSPRPPRSRPHRSAPRGGRRAARPRRPRTAGGRGAAAVRTASRRRTPASPGPCGRADRPTTGPRWPACRAPGCRCDWPPPGRGRRPA